MKRNVAHTFSMSTSVSFEPYVSSTVELFMQRMAERAAEGKPINLVQWFQVRLPSITLPLFPMAQAQLVTWHVSSTCPTSF